jgi:hypothetical protein
METFKAVVGYEKLYEVSDAGNVRTLIQKPPRLLKPGFGTSGYRFVNLTKRGEIRNRMIHRLVAEAFIGPLEKGMEVNHKNGDKHDNRLENLEFVTRSENIKHRIRVLGIKAHICRGIQSGNARFTETQVKNMREQWECGILPREIAAHYGCSLSAVWHVLKRRSWSHI